MAEGPSLSFEMHSARDAMTGGLGHLEEQIVAVEQSVREDSGFVFDLSRSLIESVCKSILAERGISHNSKDDLPKLFRTLTQQVPLLPTTESQATDVRRSLERTVNGLYTSIQGICELRNKTGYSHGSAEHRPRLEWIQGRMVAEAADAIVGFLYRIHRQDRTRPITYDENSDFNNSIDDVHDMVRIFDVEFRPSEILFEMDPEAYRIHLVEHSEQSEPANDGSTES